MYIKSRYLCAQFVWPLYQVVGHTRGDTFQHAPSLWCVQLEVLPTAPCSCPAHSGAKKQATITHNLDVTLFLSPFSRLNWLGSPRSYTRCIVILWPRCLCAQFSSVMHWVTFNKSSLASLPSLSAYLWSTFSRKETGKAGFSSSA